MPKILRVSVFNRALFALCLLANASKATEHKTSDHGCAAPKERQAGFQALNQAAQRSSALNRGADTYDIIITTLTWKSPIPRQPLPGM